MKIEIETLMKVFKLITKESKCSGEDNDKTKKSFHFIIIIYDLSFMNEWNHLKKEEIWNEIF